MRNRFQTLGYKLRGAALQVGSINYLHAGAAKTWYGIPARGAEAFERAVRAVVPGSGAAAPSPRVGST